MPEWREVGGNGGGADEDIEDTVFDEMFVEALATRPEGNGGGLEEEEEEEGVGRLG